MASIWLPSACDQENRIRLPGSTKGKAFNKLSARGSSNGKVSSNIQKGLAFPLQQQGTTGRTFGDISNLLADRGSVITPARSGKQLKKGVSSTKKPAGLNKPQQPTPVVGSNTKTTPVPVKVTDTERDFFPIIAETEDYSDVLPSSLELGQEQVLRLVQQWRVLQRASRPLSPMQPPSPPPSPSHLLLDECCDLPQFILPQQCGLEAAEEFSELQLMPVDW